MRLAWLFGGLCFGGVAIVCWIAQLKEFAIGAGFVGLFMVTESWVNDDKEMK